MENVLNFEKYESLILSAVSKMEYPAIEGLDAWLSTRASSLDLLFGPEYPLLSIEEDIAVLNCFGVVGFNLTFERIQTALDHIASMPSVHGVFMRIDSPGGSSKQCFAIDDALKAFKEKSKKPIVGYASDYATSAAYMMLARSDKAYASQIATVASIGVIWMIVDQSKSLADAGIKFNVFKSGKFKNFPNSYEAMGKEEREKAQGIVDELADDFFARVSDCRKISVDSIKALEADILDSKKGLEKGLVDGIKTEKEARAELQALIKSPKKTGDIVQISQATNLSTKMNLEVTPEIQAKLAELEKLKAERASELSSMQAELDSAKEELITQYSSEYAKATGLSCPVSKIEMLKKQSIADIKSEINHMKPFINQRLGTTAVVSESSKKKGVSQDTVEAYDEATVTKMISQIYQNASVKPKNFDLKFATQQFMSETGGIH